LRLKNTAIIIDAAPGSRAILRELKFLGGNVEAILITHGHFDHIASAQNLKKVLRAKIYLHKADLDLLPLSKIVATTYGVEWSDPEIDVVLTNDETLELGDIVIKVLHTPGHTPGSLCFLVNDSMLFTGDTLFKGTIGRTDFPGGDWNSMVISLKKLSKLPDEIVIYPGHGEPTTLGYEKRTNELLRKALETQ